MEPANPNQGKNIFFSILITILILLLLGLISYYLWTKGIIQNLLPKSSPKGFVKTQSIIKNYPNFVRNTRIFLSYEGTLTSIDPEKSWTIEKDGKQLTITNETASQKISYLKSATQSSSLSQNIYSDDFKFGDKVIINTLIDDQTGIVSVTSIVLRQ